jgi:hypothetical protein
MASIRPSFIVIVPSRLTKLDASLSTHNGQGLRLGIFRSANRKFLLFNRDFVVTLNEVSDFVGHGLDLSHN